MSVNAAGSSLNVQQAMIALRQSIQQEQVAAAAFVEAAQQGVRNAQADSQPAEGRGEKVDVKA